MGARLKWVHDSAVACLVWARWVAQPKPDIFIVECVSEWEHGPVAEMLNGDWLMLRQVFCPSDMGHPVRRKRAYFAFAWKEKFQWVHHLSNPQWPAEALFRQLSSRPVVIDGGIYMQVPPRVRKGRLVCTPTLASVSSIQTSSAYLCLSL